MRVVRHLQISLIIILLVQLFVPVGVSAISTDEDSIEQKQIESFEILSDPTLEETPYVMVQGTNGNFSWTHDTNINGTTLNRLTLEWNHVASQDLSYRPTGDYDEPDCYDFIYFRQTFDWPYDQIPLDVKINVRYRVEKSGMFEDSHFDWYVWLLTTNNWYRMYKSTPPYSTTTTHLQLDPWSQEYYEPWGYYDGEPVDSLSLAIGMAPSRYFSNFTDTVSGSVKLEIQQISLITTIDTISMIEPDFQGIDETSEIWTTMLDIAPDGSVYVLAAIGSYDSYDYDLYLSRWDARASFISSTRLSGSSVAIGYAMDIAPDGSIYSLSRYAAEWQGDYSLMLTKWAANGAVLWNAYFDDDIVVSSDGSIYGTYLKYTDELSSPYGDYIPVLVKWNSAGELQWEHYCGQLGYDEPLQIQVSDEGHIFVSTVYTFSKWDSNGIQIMNKTITMGYFDIASGSIYTVGLASYPLMVSRYTLDGIQLWNVTWEDGTSYYSAYKYPTGIEVSSNGSIFVLGTRNSAPFLAEWNSEGKIVKSGIIDVEYFRWSYYVRGEAFRLGSNGILYTVGISGEEGYLTVLGFHVLPTLIFTIDNNFMSAALGGGLTSFIIIGLVIWSKKRGLNLPQPYDSGVS